MASAVPLRRKDKTTAGTPTSRRTVRFSTRDRARLGVVARAAFPAHGDLPAGDETSVEALEHFCSGYRVPLERGVQAGLAILNARALLRHARPIERLHPAECLALLESWYESDYLAERALLRGLFTPIKTAHFDTEAAHRAVGAPFGKGPPVQPERAPWMSNCVDGASHATDEEIDCEVVIVGSGAGGGALAYELARQGVAVVVVESGHYFRRTDFNARATDQSQRMYFNQGLTLSLGNVGIAIWAGETVGGTTTINMGTCYRAPDRVLSTWSRESGLAGLTPEELGPYYDQVESMLQVGEPDRAHLGSIADVIARGADKLGLHHKPLRRNAPGCDGQGVCCFGCPTDAKRSVGVSYLPEALKSGAMLYYSTKATSLLREESPGGRERIAGVTARTRGGGTIRIRAEKTVVACGTLRTPHFLHDNGVKLEQLGRNLSIHPACPVLALMPEEQNMWSGIPQGYAIESLLDEGIALEGGSIPFPLAAGGLTTIGPSYMRYIANFKRVAMFAAMVGDTSRGRIVLESRASAPLILYNMNDHDRLRMRRGLSTIIDVFRAAGAESVVPAVTGIGEIRSDVEARKFATADIPADRFELTAHHPLGTARMSLDARSGCIGPDHQVHATDDLYIVDGSAVPSSLGVNPQMTIMALAHRAGGIIATRLEQRRRRRVLREQRKGQSAHA